MESKTSTEMMSRVLGFRNSWHHRLWYSILDDEVIQDPKSGLLIPNRIGKKNRFIMILAPRNHAKSTCFTVNYPLREIVINRNIRIVIVSSTGDNAEAFLREIKGHLEREDPSKLFDFVKVHGSLVPQFPEKWTNNQIIVERPSLRLKDPTVSAVGAGGSILSRRADIIICDDILNQENTRTPEQRFKVKSWFNEVLRPVLVQSETSRLIVVGTKWHDQDLYSELLEDEQFDIRLKMQAIVREEFLNA